MTMKPSYEVYGFVIYLSSFILLFIYGIWAFVPDPVLHSFGIKYYNDKYWAIAIPVYLCICIGSLLVFTFLWNCIQLPDFDDVYCFRDEYTRYEDDNEKKEKVEMPELMDLPIGLVNQYLYQMEE